MFPRVFGVFVLLCTAGFALVVPVSRPAVESRPKQPGVEKDGEKLRVHPQLFADLLTLRQKMGYSAAFQGVTRVEQALALSKPARGAMKTCGRVYWRRTIVQKRRFLMIMREKATH